MEESDILAIITISIFIIVPLIIGWWLGYRRGKTTVEAQKWGDKKSVLDAEWKTHIAELDGKWDKKLSELDKTKTVELEKMKTVIEKLNKDWQVKYVTDLGEFKKAFIESEKQIKKKSVSTSRRVLVGKFVEKFIPFLKHIPYEPSDMHFMGQPIDYIVFEGLHKDKIEKIVFVEVKTGESKLSSREKSLKQAVEAGKVFWEEQRIDTSDDDVPDKSMTSDEDVTKELYDSIDSKLSAVINQQAKVELSSAKTGISSEDEDKTTYMVYCDHCDEEVHFYLTSEEYSDLEEGEEYSYVCDNCHKDVIVDDADELDIVGDDE